MDEEEPECCDPAQDAVDVIRETLATTLRAISPTKGLIQVVLHVMEVFRWRFLGGMQDHGNNTTISLSSSLSAHPFSLAHIARWYRISFDYADPRFMMN